MKVLGYSTYYIQCIEILIINNQTNGLIICDSGDFVDDYAIKEQYDRLRVSSEYL